MTPRPVRVAVTPTASSAVQAWDRARREEFIEQVGLMTEHPSELLTRSSAMMGSATLWEFRYRSKVLEGWVVCLLMTWDLGSDPEFILLDVVDRLLSDD